MMHDNYDPDKDNSLFLKNGAPATDGYFLIYIEVPDTYNLSNAMLVYRRNGSYANDNVPDVNLDALLNNKILKHAGPIPYRVSV